MKRGIISDIHANKPALDAVLDELQKQEIDTIVCIGDIVGVLGFPDECVSLVREHADCVVYGNHDARLFPDREWMPVHDFEVVEHNQSMNQLTLENYEWLTSLPASCTLDETITVVHANPEGDDPAGETKGNAGVWPSDFVSVGNTTSEDQSLLLGHTHEQHAVDLSKFNGQDGVVLNPGSVGFPFDHEPVSEYTDREYPLGKASFAVLDTETEEYTLDAVTYNSQPVYEHLRKNNLLENSQ